MPGLKLFKMSTEQGYNKFSKAKTTRHRRRLVGPTSSTVRAGRTGTKSGSQC